MTVELRASNPVAVVSILESFRQCATRFFPRPMRPPIVGGGRIYLLFPMPDHVDDETYADSFGDGVIFVELRQFANEPDARSWIDADIRKRCAA